MAKKVKNSKYNAIGKDPISELQLGAGAVHLEECRLVINGGRKIKVGKHLINKIGIYGAVLTDKDITNGDDHFQMWECDIIVIPRKKYRDGFQCYRADQVLACDFANKDNWEEEIFDKNDEEHKDKL